MLGQAKFAIAYLAPQGPTLRLIFGVQRIKCKSLKRRGPSLLSLIAPALNAYKERSGLEFVVENPLTGAF